MKHLIIALCMIAIISCGKENATQPVVTAHHEDLKIITKKMKVYLCTDAGVSSCGNAYVFTVGYRTNVTATDIFTDALWYAHHKLTTGDTTLAYLFPYAVVNTNIANIYAYPDNALQNDPSFVDFKPWFQNIVSNWMAKHECSDCNNVFIGNGSLQYFTKITCNVN